MPRKFDENGYPCEVNNLDENHWFYVQKEGLEIYRTGVQGRAVIPWRKVRQALRDHEAAPKRR